MKPCHALRIWMNSRSGQDEWDRAEQARRRRPPRRTYTQRYIDALNGEPGPCRPQFKVSKSKRVRAIRPSTVRNVIAPHRKAGRPSIRVRMYKGGDKPKCGARIDEIWFERGERVSWTAVSMSNVQAESPLQDVTSVMAVASGHQSRRRRCDWGMPHNGCESMELCGL
jgi:hypothetical protein